MARVLRWSNWHCHLSLMVALSTLIAVCAPRHASASILGVPEDRSWSDIAFANGVSGSFSIINSVLSITATPSNDLELGGQFGPIGGGRHYGTGGTLGNGFSATLSVVGVEIQPNGTVTNGGSVLITYNGSGSGGIGEDYGIVVGAALLTGTVLQAELDATGANTLDVLFSITGGALQNNNPSLGTNFSPANLGLLRFAGVATPSAFDATFSFNGATLDVLGAPVPESRFATFAVFSLILVWMGGSRHVHRQVA